MTQQSTIYNSVTPFFLICLMMGTATFRLKTHKIITSWIYNILPLTLVCLNTYVFYLATLDRFFSDKFQANNSIETTTDCFQIIGAFMAQSATWIESVFAKNSLMEALRRLYEFDAIIIKRIKHDFRYDYWRKICIIQLLSGLITYSLLINTILYAYMIRFDVNSVPVWITYALPMGSSGLRYFQMINMAFIMRLRFCIINNELRKLSESCQKQEKSAEYRTKNFTTVTKQTPPLVKNTITTITHSDQLFTKNLKNNALPNFNNDIKIIDVTDADSIAPEVLYHPSNFDTYKPVFQSYNKAKILNSNALIDQLAFLCELHDELCDICGLIDKVSYKLIYQLLNFI